MAWSSSRALFSGNTCTSCSSSESSRGYNRYHLRTTHEGTDVQDADRTSSIILHTHTPPSSLGGLGDQQPGRINLGRNCEARSQPPFIKQRGNGGDSNSNCGGSAVKAESVHAKHRVRVMTYMNNTLRSTLWHQHRNTCDGSCSEDISYHLRTLLLVCKSVFDAAAGEGSPRVSALASTPRTSGSRSSKT